VCIARELHDSLTHSISVICVQSGVAAHLARECGEEVRPALLAIQEAGADTARKLRTTLSVLRSEEDGDASGLSQLARLVAPRDPRQPGNDQARCPRPGPARGFRLPGWPGRPARRWLI
jgi:signal transduction histidine kinase